jgi:hypothetical protein
MKLFPINALVLGAYVLVLGIYAWSEHEPFMIALGILPVLLFTLARALDIRFEKRRRSWTTTL